MGLYNRLHWEQGIEGWCLFLLTRFLGWQHEEVTVYVAQMRKMLRDKTVHAYHDVYVALQAFIWNNFRLMNTSAPSSMGESQFAELTCKFNL